VCSVSVIQVSAPTSATKSARTGLLQRSKTETLVRRIIAKQIIYFHRELRGYPPPCTQAEITRKSRDSIY
jgi:hypothetical protein